MKHQWYAVVGYNGEQVLFISPNELCGDDITEDLDECIETVARNLLSFIGRSYTIEKSENKFIME